MRYINLRLTYLLTYLLIGGGTIQQATMVCSNHVPILYRFGDIQRWTMAGPENLGKRSFKSLNMTLFDRLYRTIFDIFYVEEYHNLEISVRGHFRKGVLLGCRVWKLISKKLESWAAKWWKSRDPMCDRRRHVWAKFQILTVSGL